MKLTFTGTLVELGKISDLNERILRFLNECAAHEKYKDVEYQHILHDASRHGNLPIRVESEMKVIYPDAIKNTLQRIMEQTPGNSMIFSEAEEIELDLRALEHELKG